MNDVLAQLAETIRVADKERRGLCIESGATKRFYGREASGKKLSLANYGGIVSYEPTELVVTARAGCRLNELEAELATRGQILAFEPPQFGPAATVGGAVAAGLSGPRRPYAGAIRDFVLGVTAMNADGEIMRYGGQVMKNVAGFDVSRLMVGALGTLGVILEASFKVLPKPSREITLAHEVDIERGLRLMNEWAAKPTPVSATAWMDGVLRVRISGSIAALSAARRSIGGEEDADGDKFWLALREQSLPFFVEPGPLWRLSVPPAVTHIEIAADTVIEWGGAQRWLRGGSIDFERLTRLARGLGGHASVFRGGERDREVFSPLVAPMQVLHRRVKAAFDPHGIFNPGRLYGSF